MDIKAQIHQELEKLQSELEKVDAAVELIHQLGQGAEEIAVEGRKMQTEYREHLSKIQKLVDKEIVGNAQELKLVAEKIETKVEDIKQKAQQVFKQQAAQLNSELLSFNEANLEFRKTLNELIGKNIPLQIDTIGTHIKQILNDASMVHALRQELKEAQDNTQQMLNQQFEASQKKTGQLQTLLIASVGLSLLSIILHFF